MFVLVQRFTKIAKILTISFVFLGIIAQSTPAEALTGSQFKPGNIINNSLFYRQSSMSVSSIQSFLNSKVPDCDTNGAEMYSSTKTRAQYGKSKGYPPPYICLKNKVVDRPARSAVSGLCSSIGKADNQKASQIIYAVSNACGVDSKVLIVMLQKEQALVTDEWPWSKQYKIAMGYGCPDTAPCDSDYFGFFNQVYNAAKQLKRYARDPQDFSYRAGRTNYIQYNPNASCGGKNVYIENSATAALYNYTPYVPNASALSNLYGTGNSCSAYGNRNFWRMYNDWFGSTITGSPYSALISEHSAYPTIKQGEIAPIYVRFTNTGAGWWYDDSSATAAGKNPVRIATDIPLNHMSPLGGLWSYKHRPGIGFDKVLDSDGTLASDQTVVKTGQMAEFWFAYYAPHALKPGVYTEGFRPIVEGEGPMNSTGSFVKVTVNKAIYNAEHAGQSNYVSLNRGQSASVFMKYKNVGNVPWYDETSKSSPNKLATHLATDYSLNRASNFSSAWPFPHRAAVNFGAVYEANGTTLTSNQHVVQPGQIARFNFAIIVPSNQTFSTYRESFRPVIQGFAPMNDPGTWLGITVQ
jgi:hypothetical protein